MITAIAARAALAVAAIAAIALLAKRRARRDAPPAPVSVVARAPLGPGVGLALVVVSGRRLVVGFGKDGVRLVRDLGASEVRP